ncbi:hypothetical protein BT96DRAFT_749317, partial [Gymnopus androsaceus JB14]
MVKCSPTKKSRVVRMHDIEKMDFRDIGLELGFSTSTAHRNYTKMKRNPNPYQKSTNHNRKPLFSKRDRRKAVQAIDTGKCRDGSDVQKKLFPEISPRRVREMLAQEGLNGRVRRPKPLLKTEH